MSRNDSSAAVVIGALRVEHTPESWVLIIYS